MEDSKSNTKIHNEAIRRLRILGTKQKIIDKFDATESIALITLNRTDYHQVNEKYLKIVSAIEEEFSLKVYMAIRKFINGRGYIALLFVSNNEDNWSDERDKLKSHDPFSYLFDADMLSMFLDTSILCVDHSGNMPCRIWIKE